MRAFRRAARSAFLWPEEVSDLVAQNRSLTELRGIGPFIEKQIRQWIEKPRRSENSTRNSPGFSLASLRHDASSRRDLPGQRSCAAICRCTLAGATDQARSRKWPMPLRTAFLRVHRHHRSLQGLEDCGRNRRARIETPGSGNSKGQRGTVKIGGTRDCPPLDRNESEPARRRRHVAGLAAIFGSCSRLVPFGFTHHRRSNRALSRSIAQSTRSHPRSPARSYLQLSDRA